MAKQKSVKRALLLSAMALLMCVSMLIGTTFAWFTDNVTSTGNRIQSGKLKVDIVDTNNTSLVGQGLAFENVNGSTDILWEPGATFRTQAFKIKNIGNLAFKYRLILNGIDGDADLLDVITFSIIKADGTAVELDTFEGVLNEQNELSEVYMIQGVMDSAAGNDYQDKQLDGISVTVVAGQAMHESDIFDDTYDATAEYPQSQSNQPQVPTFTVGTATQLQAAMQPTGNGDDRIVNITADLELAAGETWIPLGLDSYTGVSRLVINGNGHTVKGLNDVLLSQAIFGNTKVVINDLTLENSTVNATGNYASAFIGNADHAISVELYNCHVKDSTITSAKYSGGLIGYVSGPAIIKDCSVTNTTISGESVGALAGMFSTTPIVTVSGATVTGNTLTSLKNGTYRVGELVGTSNVDNLALSGITASGNTCTQAGASGFDAGMVSTAWIGRTSSNVTGDTSARIN